MESAELQRSRGFFSPLVLSLAAVSLLLLSIIGFGFAKPAHAAQTSEDPIDVVLTIEPSRADGALLSVVQQSLARVDKDSLLKMSDEDQVARLQKKYQSLEKMVQNAQQGTSVFLLRSVSPSLIEAFEGGNLPQPALFSASGSVTSFDPKDITPSFTASNKIKTVTVSRSQVDVGAIVSALKAFETEYQEVDPSYRPFLKADMTSLQQLDDQQLQEVVDKGISGVSESAQVELDNRLAKKLPSLATYENGLLPDELLCKIPWDSAGHQTLCPVLGNLSRLNQAFKAKFGIDLPILDGYRPLSSQVAVHYNDPTMTAVPGTSNHGWGLAIDFDWDLFNSFDAPEVIWMIQNAPTYGWRHPAALGKDTDRPEPWHFEFGTSYPDSPEFDGPEPATNFRFTF